MRTLLTFFVFLPFLSFAQVGVNTTTPNAALDIQSTNNGVLIPRVQLTDALDIVTVVNPAGGVLAKSTLVYNIGSSGIAPDNVIDGFYYWNGVRWMPISASTPDHDWYKVGTTTAPTAISDNIFHSGKVAIGKNTANANLDIFSSTLDASIVNELNNPDNNDQTTIFNTISGLGTSPHIGVWNWLFGKGNIVGSINQLNSSSDGTGFIRGVETSISGSGNTEQSGVWTLLESDGDNIHTGIYSSLGGAGNGRHIGSDNLLYSSGTGTKYGTRNIIADAAGGQHFGVYSEVLKPGSNFAGYFRGKVAIGTNATIGIDDYIFPSTRGTNGQIMQTDGAGNVTWQNASFDHDWYEVGTTTPPNDITDDMFHMGNMAIGKNTADYPLEVNTTNFQFGMYNTLNNTTTTSQQKATIKNDVFDNTNDPKYGVINTVTNNSVTSGGIGVRNNIGGDGTTFFGNSNYLAAGAASNGADIIGIRNDLATDSNNASIKGAYNIFSGTSGNLNFMYGNLNDFRASANRKFGTFNIFNANTDGYNIGLYNNLLSDLAANDQYGVWNNFNTGSLTNGDNYGLYNLFSGDGISSKIGNYTRIDSDGDGQHIGAMQLINGSATGLGTKYGTLTIINNTAGGTHYGIHSTVLKPGANNFAGYFLGNVGIGTTALNTYTFPPSRGTNGQIMQTDGSGNVSWQNPGSVISSTSWSINGNSSITTPASPVTYGTSTLTAGENFLGTTNATDVTLATNNIERMRIKNTTGNVGIGTATPLQPLHVYKNSNTTKSAILGEAIQTSTSVDYQNRGIEGYGSGTSSGGGYGYGIGVIGIGDRANSYYATGVLSYLGTTTPDAPSTNQALLADGNNLGNAAILTNGNVGIGIPLGTNPTNQLHISSTTNGAVRIVDGTEGNNKILTSNATGVATWQNPNPSGFTHYLGELYLGGVIYELYKGSDGLEHGLIVSLLEGGPLAWQTVNSVVGANRSEDGVYNTALMINSPVATFITTLGAGWYLPSIDELNLLYNHRYYVNKTLRLGGYQLLSLTRFYWSSNEYSINSSYAYNFLLGYATSSDKSDADHVRGIRAF